MGQVMGQVMVSPVVLIILDGWGYRESKAYNAIALASTPVMDSLWEVYPHTLIRTSGRDVGLPDGQMGNSEVGHLNLGAGRIVPQELVRISDAVDDGSLLENRALLKLCQEVKQRQGKLHFVGLCSDGGVHSHLNHLLGLISLAQANELEYCIHAITDGRDTLPMSGKEMLRSLHEYVQQTGGGCIATVSGRYYSMDRDKRWERTQKAYQLMTEDGAGTGQSIMDALADSYAAGIADEFILPTRLAPGAVVAGDGMVFFNFRPDRARQLTQVFVDPQFKGFERSMIQPLSFVSFTQYDAKFAVDVAFEPQNLDNILGQVLAQHGLRQLRTAETEKYAHVTYFFNGGIEQPFDGEDREMIPSPNVATYDQAPAMSAEAVTQVAIDRIEKGIYSMVVLNYANPDMVGHTGNLEATEQAIATVDRCLGRLLAAIGKMGGTALITADHGNAEYMQDENGNPWTAHTTNPVPFVLIEGERRKIPGHGGEIRLRSDGRLCDVAPTILEILQIPQPAEMTGRSLIEPAWVETRPNRTPVRLGRGI